MFEQDASPSPIPPRQAQLESDAGCRVNAECDDESICVRGSCLYFGECLQDWHCGGAPRYCEKNVCQGEFGSGGGGSDVHEPCRINDDCADGEYCVDGACRHGIECMRHADCDPAFACLATRCLSAF